DLDALATQLYRDEYRCRPARDSRADLSVADDDVAAHLPWRATRHPPGTGERHGLVAVPASGLGARVQSRSFDRQLVRVDTGYAVRGGRRERMRPRMDGQCRYASRAQSIHLAVRELRRRVCQ